MATEPDPPDATDAPKRSLPGGRPRAGRRPPVPDDELSPAQRLWRSEWHEQDRALGFALRTAVVTGVLLVLGALPLGRAQIFRDNGFAGPGPWAGSLATLILLLVAVQLVAVLLAAEHPATRATVAAGEKRAIAAARKDDADAARAVAAAMGGPDAVDHAVEEARHAADSAELAARDAKRANTVVWVLRGLVVLTVLLAVLVGWVAERLWERPGWIALGAQLVALGVMVIANDRLGHPLGPPARREADRKARAAQVSAAAEERHEQMRATGGGRGDGTLPPDGDRATPDTDVDPDSDTEHHRLLAIGASGGGIRATAFVLGGYQATQAAARDLEVEAPRNEPHLFAVSGGSYIAAALALRRTYDENGGLRGPADPGRNWRTAFGMDSPELERLRRHTRYLYEPAGRALDGVVALVIGAVINLLIVGLVLRTVTWFSVQLGVTVTFVSTRAEDACGQLPGLGLACGWGGRNWLLWLAPSLLLVLAVLVLTIRGWRSTRAFDAGTTQERAGSARTLEQTSRLRPVLLLSAVGWLVLSAGIPAAAVGVTNLVTANQPTTMVAGALHAAGFGTRDMCVKAFETNVGAAVEEANNQAKVSPGNKREVTAGACGVETTVSRTVDARGTSDTSDDVVIEFDEQAARDLIGKAHPAGPAAGAGALLALVLALLRRGPSPEANASARWWTKAKRVLLTWLPLALVAALAVYVVLLWSFGLMVKMDTDYRGYTALLTVLGFALAFLVDANATSMHGFYRSRLSDAFAATVDASGRARGLPNEHVYRFSDMGVLGDPGARLHIVSTLNSQQPNEAPTMRGGFPLVFGPEHVHIYREERTQITVPTATFEEFAGPGRVSVMAAVAISGAAISPLMGRFAVQMAPYRLLLALFNLRIGAWVHNPLHAGATSLPESVWDTWLWMTRKPGLLNVAAEGAGNASANERWVYLSDGGHLDNTGLVECVRHAVVTDQCGRILVLDASNDPVDSWSAVGDAVAVVRADLNVDLRRTDLTGLPPWMRRYRGGGLDVVVVKAIRTPDGSAEPHDTTWWDQLPPNVQSFQLVHKDFPRSSTARQKFGDLEFEAYRGLGFAAAGSALRAAGWSTTVAGD